LIETATTTGRFNLVVVALVGIDCHPQPILQKNCAVIIYPTASLLHFQRYRFVWP